MKAKYVFISKKEFQKWINTGNQLAKSLCPTAEVLKQYNCLTAQQRISIRKQFSECDNIRKIQVKDDRSAWLLGIMVDAHIIACEYNIDPLTAVLCISPLCKPNEKIVVK